MNAHVYFYYQRFLMNNLVCKIRVRYCYVSALNYKNELVHIEPACMIDSPDA